MLNKKVSDYDFCMSGMNIRNNISSAGSASLVNSQKPSLTAIREPSLKALLGED
jgi:hypothetical protein